MVPHQNTLCPQALEQQRKNNRLNIRPSQAAFPREIAPTASPNIMDKRTVLGLVKVNFSNLIPCSLEEKG